MVDSWLTKSTNKLIQHTWSRRPTHSSIQYISIQTQVQVHPQRCLHLYKCMDGLGSAYIRKTPDWFYVNFFTLAVVDMLLFTEILPIKGNSVPFSRYLHISVHAISYTAATLGLRLTRKSQEVNHKQDNMICLNEKFKGKGQLSSSAVNNHFLPACLFLSFQFSKKNK